MQQETQKDQSQADADDAQQALREAIQLAMDRRDNGGDVSTARPRA